MKANARSASTATKPLRVQRIGPPSTNGTGTLGSSTVVSTSAISGSESVVESDKRKHGTQLQHAQRRIVGLMSGDPLDDLRRDADDLIARGIRRIHVLAWRDLDDPEGGGSEVHADEFERRWADAGLALRLLGWRARHSLDEMCIDTWRWQSGNPTGYRI